jgi:hypothetical protein
MIHTMTSAQALQGRRIVKSAGTGVEHWTTDFFGARSREIRHEPQSMLIEMSAEETIVSHFHAVDQFQVFVAGGGSLARHATNGVIAQYVDHHTGYGPIVAGPQGLSYFVLRAKTDSGAVYLDKPGYRDQLKPSKKRNRITEAITLSTEPVLLSRRDVVLEALLKKEDCADGLGIFVLRMGRDMIATGPDPAGTQGQYYLVLNGSLECKGQNCPAWSTVFVDGNEPPVALRSGAQGVEALVMQFPPADQ